MSSQPPYGTPQGGYPPGGGYQGGGYQGGGYPPPPSYQPQGSSFGDFLAFRKMITPIIIQIIFWILVAAVVLIGFFGIIGGVSMPYGGGEAILGGFILIVLGPVLVRVYCEIAIVFFRMNETLTDIKTALERR